MRDTRNRIGGMVAWDRYVATVSKGFTVSVRAPLKERHTLHLLLGPLWKRSTYTLHLLLGSLVKAE